jgi:hypothetical protein
MVMVVLLDRIGRRLDDLSDGGGLDEAEIES